MRRERPAGFVLKTPAQLLDWIDAEIAEHEEQLNKTLDACIALARPLPV